MTPAINFFLKPSVKDVFVIKINSYALIEIILAYFKLRKQELKANLFDKRTKVLYNRPNVHMIAELARPETNEVSAKQVEINEHPKTFSELLLLRIDRKILPEGQTSFTKQELKNLTKGVSGKKEVFGQFNKKTLSREEAIEMIERIFRFHKKPRTKDSDQKKRYGITYFLRHTRLEAKWLDGWTDIIGWDWEENKTIEDPKEIKAILGLVRLENLINRSTETPKPEGQSEQKQKIDMSLLLSIFDGQRNLIPPDNKGRLYLSMVIKARKGMGNGDLQEAMKLLAETFTKKGSILLCQRLKEQLSIIYAATPLPDQSLPIVGLARGEITIGEVWDSSHSHQQ